LALSSLHAAAEPLPRRGDTPGIAAGGGGKIQKRLLVSGVEFQDAAEKARIGRSRPQAGGSDSRQGEEPAQPFRVGGEVAERLDGDGLVGPQFVAGGGLCRPERVHCAGVPFAFRQRYWPKKRAGTTNARLAAIGAPRRGGGAMAKAVMIVEDNELNMKLFNDLLEANGYRTIKTSNGMEALDLARKHRPDLILMDIQLPEVSGLDVIRWLKEDDSLHKIPVIAVTAFAMKGDEERIRQTGCESYISKPISVSSFIETVKTYLGDN
jgi:two-component system cell cycle response regulator DivK